MIADLTPSHYWKNSTRTDLAVIDASKDAFTESIFVSGIDVYVAGKCTNSADIDVPCYWKNGTRTELSVPDPTKDSYANSIFVVKH